MTDNDKQQSTEDAAKPETRRKCQINIPTFSAEKAIIERNAGQTGLSVARFLRELGLGYEVKGIVDCEQVRKLAEISGNQGRLGGLLKLWLSDHPRAAEFGPETIRAVLHKIEANEEEMTRVMMKIVTRSKAFTQ